MVGWLSRAFDLLEFLQLGVSSNWFGLACPHHCGSSTFPALALAFLLGNLCGFLLGLSAACFLLRLIYPGFFPSVPSRAVSRLRGYSV